MPNRKSFRKLISKLESSGGVDTDHRTLSSGMHKDTTAMGEYGLMPVTAQDLAKRDKDPVGLILKGLAPQLVKPVLEDNPQKYDELVNRMIDRVQRHGGDPVDQYVRYNFGQNLNNAEVSQIKQDNPNFINKIERNMQGLSSEPDSFVDSIPQPIEEPVLSSQPRKLKRMLGKQ